MVKIKLMSNHSFKIRALPGQLVIFISGNDSTFWSLPVSNDSKNTLPVTRTLQPAIFFRARGKMNRKHAASTERSTRLNRTVSSIRKDIRENGEKKELGSVASKVSCDPAVDIVCVLHISLLLLTLWTY